MAGIIFSQGSGVNDSIFGKSQAPIKAVIEQGVESFQEMSAIDKIFYMDSSSNYAEKYTSETSLGDFEDVGENGAYPKTSMQEGFSKTIEPTTWKSSFEATQEMIEDAKFGKIKSRASIFATSYNRTREKFAADMIAGGLGTSITLNKKKYDTKSADGVSLFSTAHPSITKGCGPQSNIFKSTNAFTQAVIQKMLDTVQEKMQKFTDDDGNLLNVAPDTIIIPNNGAIKRMIFGAVGSELDPATNNNAVNFQLGLWNVIVWNYLPSGLGTGSKPYFIMLDSKFNQDYMCLPWVDRLKLTVKSDIDSNTDANVWKGRARFGAGFNNWRSISICGEGLTGSELA